MNLEIANLTGCLNQNGPNRTQMIKTYGTLFEEYQQEENSKR